jgi:predicted ester cyclase
MRRLAILVLAVQTLIGVAAASANDTALVRSLYDKLLNGTTAPDLAQRAEAILAPNWATRGNNAHPAGSVADFVRNLQGFGQAIPNLRWEIQEIISSGDRHVVRGRATGTPAKPVFGVEPTGKSFDIMSIDIHTVRGGRIVETYHVEDWAGAIRQLRAP